LGHKVHPTGFRLGVIKDWQSKWYTDTSYDEFVLEDVKLRNTIRSKYPEAAISLIEIDRQAKDVTITLHTARPGIVIGRGGQRVDEMRRYLEGLIGKKIRLNILEVRQPEMDAYLVARSVAEQIERRIAYRRAMKQAIFRTIQAGARGIKISCAGRLGNAEIARRQTSHEGQVPLHTLRADIDYGFTEAHTTLGRIGVKVWIYKGQILPEPKAPEVEEETPPEAEIEEPEAEALEETAEKPAEAKAEAPEPAVEEAEEKPAEAVAEATEPAVEETEEKAAEPVAEAPEAVAVEETEEKAAKAKKTTTTAAKKPKAPPKKKESTTEATAEVAEKEKPAAKKTRKTAKAKKEEAETDAGEAAEPVEDTEEEAKDAAA
jgi:small subunit ribosomal protein S3